MTDSFLPYGRQAIDDDDIAAVAAVLKSDALTTGPEVDRFEQALSQISGAAHAVSCNSGTAALHLAVAGLGIGEGDRVVVPTLTFLASANCARYAGAEVIFADVNPDTGLMEAGHLAAALERAPKGSVKAVIPVHLAGQCCDTPAIAKLATSHGIAVIEDACHAVGGIAPDNSIVGSCAASVATCFSFHPVKTVATGEGGAVTTNDAKLDSAMRTIRNHGMVRQPKEPIMPEYGLGADGQPNPWYYEMPDVGWNYRLSDIHAALGRSQLRKLPAFVAQRATLVARYDAAFAKHANRIRPLSRVGGKPGWHLYVVQIDFAAIGKDRASVMRTLSARGIGTQVHYLPVHLQPYYQRRYGRQTLPGAESYYASCLSLPLFPTMTDADVDRVVNTLTDVIGS
jgi:UDP-4-amino-4,6-dideoxy-N-acetyl-beta-L-altrosamine transaminase